MPYEKVCLLVAMVVTFVLSVLLNGSFALEAPVVVIDHDNSHYSRELIGRIDASEYMRVTAVVNNAVTPESFADFRKYDIGDIIGASGYVFKTKTGGEIDIEQLSSGEKQLLYILLQVFLQEKKKSILIMDEPEISLHISWQQKLIDVICEMNPNCQLIVATHSPSIFGKGWSENIVYMEDITKDSAEK